MVEIVVLSGKGGSGKTSVTAALARAWSKTEKILLCDYDVDAPDLHIILNPDVKETHEFVSGTVAEFIEDECIDCGQCLEFCKFDAIGYNEDERVYTVDETACEGCTVCSALCPMDAFKNVPRHCGQYFVSETRFGPFVHAQLTPGSENSGRLITVLKELARDKARAEKIDLILSDGTPGIGCPVISSLSNATLVCAVVEATASGIADFERLAELAKHFRLPVAAIINKADLHPEEAIHARKVLEEVGATVLGDIPFTAVFTAAMSRGEAIGETPSELDEKFEDFARQLKNLAESSSRARRFIPIKEKHTK